MLAEKKQTKSVISKTQRDINENDENESEKVVHAHEEQMRESGRGEGWWGVGGEKVQAWVQV